MLKHLTPILAFSTIASAVCQRAAAQTTIINTSTMAGPGDIINLQGHNFGDRPKVWCAVNGGKPAIMPVINRGNGIIHAQLPAAAGRYTVWVRNGKQLSNVVAVNEPKLMHTDVADVYPGGTVRIFGRNLNAPGRQSKLPLKNGTKSYEAVVEGGNASERLKGSVLPVRIPEHVAPGDYALGLNDTQTLAVRVLKRETRHPSVYNVKTDPRLKLHAVGDGKINDQAAVQAAIDLAIRAGGGVIYLPAGHYKMLTEHGPLMTVGKNIVIRGDGPKRTQISYGYGKPGTNFYVTAFEGAVDSGIESLAIENQNEGDVWLNSGSICTTSRNCKNISLKNIRADIKNSARIELKGHNIQVKDCDLKALDTLLFMGDCTHSGVSNCTLLQKLGVHLDVTNCDSCVVEKNTFFLDADGGKVTKGHVRHGMAIGFAKNLAILDNTWSVINGAATCNNDGEAILSEGGGGMRPGEEFDDVVSADQNAVTTTKVAKFVPDSVVAIVHGLGMGQWRGIKGRQDRKVLLDRPFSLTPDKTSRYAIFKWSTRNTLIAGNTFQGWPRGLWIYQGSTSDTQISGNNFLGMDGIFLEPCQNITRGLSQVNPIWNLLVDNNRLSSGEAATFINMTADLQQTTKLLATLALNVQFYNNTIIGNGSKVFHNDPACFEGYCNYLRVEAPEFQESEVAPVPALLGTLYQDNTATGCATAYSVNGGAYQTTFADCTSSGALYQLNDAMKYWNISARHKSVGTIHSHR